ncbi:hypothetical protein BD414DRAFT_424666 [Trametes punicea]|nr:hypothetical protein BD414DRAFT_424666 [Trametes punicea]
MAGAFGVAPPSYLIPPVQLPQTQTPAAQTQGLSPDYIGYPPPGFGGGPGATPFTRGSTMPPSTPYVSPGGPTAYNGFQQPLPGYGYPMGVPMATPYMPMMGGMVPPGMSGPPAGMPMGWPPFTPGLYPGGAAIPGGAAVPGVPAAPRMQPTSSGNGQGFFPPKDKGPWDQFDKFSEGGDYGPVLKPMLVQRLKVRLEINPLIQPLGDDTDREYLRWNMLFPTGNCQRSDERRGQSWYKGRNAPATWPRVTSLRLVSRSFPWAIEVPAAHPEIGVTCGDVMEAIHTALYTRISQAQYDNASRQQKRLLSESYYHNRSTADDVPGGRLPQTLLRFDWLGQDTWFGGVIDDAALVHDVCKCALPCTLALVCTKRSRIAEAEMRAQEERAEEERHRRRSRSRGASQSRTASTRPSTRPPSRAPPDDSTTTSSSPDR